RRRARGRRRWHAGREALASNAFPATGGRFANESSNVTAFAANTFSVPAAAAGNLRIRWTTSFPPAPTMTRIFSPSAKHTISGRPVRIRGGFVVSGWLRRRPEPRGSTDTPRSTPAQGSPSGIRGRRDSGSRTDNPALALARRIRACPYRGLHFPRSERLLRHRCPCSGQGCYTRRWHYERGPTR